MTSQLPHSTDANLRENRELTERKAALATDVRDAIETGRGFVLSKQRDDGMWTGDTSADIRTTAEYVAMCAWFGMESTEPARSGADWLRDVVQDEVVRTHLDVGTLALVRLALHVCGESMHSGVSLELDSLIRLRGSHRRADNVARIYLAVFNQISFAECEASPPELVLLPAWAPVSLARHDRWSRAIRVPLSVLAALRPRKISITPMGKAPQSASRPRRRPGPNSGLSIPQRICLSGLQLSEWLGFDGLRNWALRKARQWIVTRISAESGVAGSMSATALSAIALSCLGYERTSPAVSRCFEALQGSLRHSGGIAARSVPNFETALAISGLAASGISTSEPAVRHAVEGILDREIVRHSDGSEMTNAEPGGWSSEANNDHFPNIDCTAATLVALRAHFAASPASSLVTDDSMVAMIRANSLNLARQRIALLDRVAAASRRARRWVVALQHVDGSWSSAVPSCTWHATEQCDQRHLAAATTGLVLQALGRWEMRSGQAAVDRAVAYLRAAQSSSGLWAGGGLFDYYATWMAIEGLLAVGVDSHDPAIQQAIAAVAASPNPDGGFGPSSASQPNSSTLSTAWALSALMTAHPSGDAIDEKNDNAADRAAAWLLDRQLPTGEWRVDEKSVFSTLGPLTVSDTICSIYALQAVTRWAMN